MDRRAVRLRIGDGLDALAAPGEVVTRLGTALRGRLQAPATMFLGLTNDALGYFVPKDEWMSEPRHKQAFTSELLVNWDELNKTSSDIKVSPYDKQVVDLKGKSLYQALNKHKPYQFPKEDARLFLNSKM